MVSFSIRRTGRYTIRYEENDLIFEYAIENLIHDNVVLYSASPKVLSGSIKPSEKELKRVKEWLEVRYDYVDVYDSLKQTRYRFKTQGIDECWEKLNDIP